MSGQWTIHQPTEPGYYWISCPQNRVELVQVYHRVHEPRGLWVRWMARDMPSAPIQNFAGHAWSGPIPSPEPVPSWFLERSR